MTKKSAAKPGKAGSVELKEADLEDVQGGMETVSLNFSKIEYDYVGTKPRLTESTSLRAGIRATDETGIRATDGTKIRK